MIRHYKGKPSEYVIKHVRGRTVKEGRGISFLYFGSTTSVVSVPLSTSKVGFRFSETTIDFQTVTVDAHAAYRISEPTKTAALLDYTIDPRTREYTTDGPAKLDGHVTSAVQEAMRTDIQRLRLEDVLRRRAVLMKATMTRLRQSQDLELLGVDVLRVFVKSVKPTPEIAKAFEEDYRESLAMKAERAVFEKRMAALNKHVKTAAGVGATDDPDGVECTDSCPFAQFCEDYRAHIRSGKTWCTLFQEFSR